MACFYCKGSHFGLCEGIKVYSMCTIYHSKNTGWYILKALHVCKCKEFIQTRTWYIQLYIYRFAAHNDPTRRVWLAV